MNGKCAKRIRKAHAVAVGKGFKYWGEVEPTIKSLKREYRAMPYHRRDMRTIAGTNRVRKGHSARLHDHREREGVVQLRNSAYKRMKKFLQKEQVRPRGKSVSHLNSLVQKYADLQVRAKQAPVTEHGAIALEANLMRFDELSEWKKPS